MQKGNGFILTAYSRGLQAKTKAPLAEHSSLLRELAGVQVCSLNHLPPHASGPKLNVANQ